MLCSGCSEHWLDPRGHHITVAGLSRKDAGKRSELRALSFELLAEAQVEEGGKQKTPTNKNPHT